MNANKEKIPIVMTEFKHGTLHSGSGDIVKNRQQAIAIAMSEAGLKKRKAPKMLRAAMKRTGQK
jgi:hypothetical protein